MKGIKSYSNKEIRYTIKRYNNARLSSKRLKTLANQHIHPFTFNYKSGVITSKIFTLTFAGSQYRPMIISKLMSTIDELSSYYEDVLTIKDYCKNSDIRMNIKNYSNIKLY